MRDVPGFAAQSLTFEGATRTVFHGGAGRAVIVMPEIPGITPAVADFAQRVTQAGYRVYLPQLFGAAMQPPTPGHAFKVLARACIMREFKVLASDQSSPIVGWLRALARHAHSECGGRGVAAIGMCFTGNFALAMMLDAPVTAAVLSQPSLPFAFSGRQRAALHASPQEIAAARRKLAEEGAGILALRFIQDPMCPAERFARLRDEFGDGCQIIEIDAKHANPQGPKPAHSVLTNHLIDQKGQPTRDAMERTLAFLGEHL